MIFSQAWMAIVIAAALLSSFSTYKIMDWRADAAELARTEAAAELTKMQNLAASVAATAHENAKVKINTEYLVVTKEVENVVTKIEYRDRICFDDDGVRAHNHSVRLTGNTSEPSNIVSAP